MLKVEDFNGKDKEYQVTLNEHILLNCDINAGSVFAITTIDFYDTNNNILCSATLQISIKFLSNKTILTLSTTGNENASFLEQYFSDFGIRLKVIEIL